MRLFCILLTVLCSISTPVLAQDIPRPLYSIPFMSRSIVGISPDASHIAIWESSQQLTLYDMAKFYKPLLTTPIKDNIRELVWSSDHADLLLVTYEKLYLLDVPGNVIKQIGHSLDKAQFMVVQFFQDDRYIVAQIGHVSGSSIDDPETYVWDAHTLNEVLHLPATHHCPAAFVPNAFSAQITHFMRQGGFLQCPTYGKWNAAQSQYLTWMFWNTSKATTIKIYDSATQKLNFELSHYSVYSTSQTPLLADLAEVIWSPDGSRIVSVPQFGRDKINVWDATTGKLIFSLLPITSTDKDGTGAGDLFPLFSPDGKQLITAGTTGYFFVWDMKSGHLVYEWHFSNYWVRGAKWIYNNSLVVGWGLLEPSSRKGVSIWDAATGNLRALLAVDADPETVVENKKNNLLLVVSSTSIEIYDLVKLATH
jgi:hypothetical protein